MATEETVKYLLVGGGLANATAAQTIREKDPDGRILIVGAEKELPYHRPPLSKEYLRGEMEWKEALAAPAHEWNQKNIEVRTGVRATRLDTGERTVTLDDETTLHYEKLCLATGATPRTLDVPGADAPNVYLLRTREDSDAIAPELRAGARAVLIGAGYIGMEVAAGCRQKEVEATVLDSASRPWAKNTSPTFGTFFRNTYEEHGVRFVLDEGVAEIVTEGKDGRASAVKTKSGQTLPCDFVVVGVGVSLNTQLAKDAGLAVDEREGIEVNEYLETSVPGIWAAGDVAKFKDPVLGKSWHIEHWQNAEWHGQIAGANLAATADRVAYDHVPYFFSDEFDLHMTLRGDPQDWKTSFTIDKPASEAHRYFELYLREDGTLAMGLLLSTEYEETPTSDLLEKLIRARVNLAPHQAEIASGKRDLASFS